MSAMIVGGDSILLQKHSRDGFHVETFKNRKACLEQLMYETCLDFPASSEGYGAHIAYLTEQVAIIRAHHDKDLQS